MTEPNSRVQAWIASGDIAGATVAVVKGPYSISEFAHNKDFFRKLTYAVSEHKKHVEMGKTVVRPVHGNAFVESEPIAKRVPQSYDGEMPTKRNKKARPKRVYEPVLEPEEEILPAFEAEEALTAPETQAVALETVVVEVIPPVPTVGIPAIDAPQWDREVALQVVKRFDDIFGEHLANAEAKKGKALIEKKYRDLILKALTQLIELEVARRSYFYQIQWSEEFQAKLQEVKAASMAGGVDDLFDALRYTSDGYWLPKIGLAKKAVTDSIAEYKKHFSVDRVFLENLFRVVLGNSNILKADDRPKSRRGPQLPTSETWAKYVQYTTLQDFDKEFWAMFGVVSMTDSKRR